MEQGARRVTSSAIRSTLGDVTDNGTTSSPRVILRRHDKSRNGHTFLLTIAIPGYVWGSKVHTETPDSIEEAAEAAAPTLEAHGIMVEGWEQVGDNAYVGVLAS
jgi:hypothetical protein